MNDSTQPQSNKLSRREFARRLTFGAAALTASGALVNPWRARAASENGPAYQVIPLDQDWLFAGKYDAAANALPGDDKGFTPITLPHCVTKLSWENWDPQSWESVWLYRRHFALPKETAKHRVFVKFDGVMAGAKPLINGVALPEHLGGYLPFQHELTQWLKDGDNIIDVMVDARWQNVPPAGSPKGPRSVDYFLPGGICRSVSLAVVPPVYIRDVHAKPVNVLQSNRTVEITCTLDANAGFKTPCQVKVELFDGTQAVDQSEKSVTVENEGETTISLTLSKLSEIKLWDTEKPQLYQIVTTLTAGNGATHTHQTRIGFREAKFTVDGFFLNGKRKQLFGLDRHESFPYVGNAMPPRVMRRDAEILKKDFNCNVVRCSHYPQTEAFLDACDELGLMVWQETPGWGYLGDEEFRELVVQNVTDMIVRDRNHPAIIIWGVRVNESRNEPTLYHRTTELAKALDGTRPCSGSMTTVSRRNWDEDVFAYDDYQNDKAGGVGIAAPKMDVPFMLAETVGQFSYGAKGFNNKYRRGGDLELQTSQAIFHAEAHEKAARNKGNSGVIAWCAFDYGSLMNAFNAIKCPGVADPFRIPKLGAAFYLAQGDPKVKPVIATDFYWDFGPKSPRGPGRHAAVFSNCDALEIFVDGKSLGKSAPDAANFSHLAHAPFFCDLDLDGASHPELRIDGYVDGAKVLSKSFSSDPSHDQFLLAADDDAIRGDGADATRVVFKVADQYGNERAFADGSVTFELTGPGVLVGDTPFSLIDSGGVGAVWLKSAPKAAGPITVTATHSALGRKTVTINAQEQGKA